MDLATWAQKKFSEPPGDLVPNGITIKISKNIGIHILWGVAEGYSQQKNTVFLHIIL